MTKSISIPITFILSLKAMHKINQDSIKTFQVNLKIGDYPESTLNKHGVMN